jgi:hypothetical protein
MISEQRVSTIILGWEYVEAAVQSGFAIRVASIDREALSYTSQRAISLSSFSESNTPSPLTMPCRH